MADITLTNIEGIARLSGTDGDGNKWIQFEVDYFAEQTDGICVICGKDLSTGWMCLDGGDEVCDTHINMNDQDTYQVIVGNIGTVYDGDCLEKATATYNEYVEQSQSGTGRAGNEEVTLFKSGEPLSIEGINDKAT